jgi:hypothetical protein
MRRISDSFDRVARKRLMNIHLLDSNEWDALEEAMLFCLAMEREQIPLKEHELRWIEFRQYVIDQGDLTHESRLVAVTEARTSNPKKTKKRARTLFVGTGGTIEETVWDLLEQVAKELQVRRELNKLPAHPVPARDSLIQSTKGRDGMVSFAMPPGAWFMRMVHGKGCICGECHARYGRHPN